MEALPRTESPQTIVKPAVVESPQTIESPQQIDSSVSRTVLHIVDGLRGVWHGGPAAFTPEFFWYPKFLQFGTDPVAIDRLLVDTVEKKRREMGAVSLYNRDPQYLGGTRADRKIMLR